MPNIGRSPSTSGLEREGFRIARNLADIPTAVMGEAGEGGPVIAFLGEYDALRGLSEEAGVAEPQPLLAGTPSGGSIPVEELNASNDD
jgi:aminobenzoyl-glutamate utilization protein B